MRIRLAVYGSLRRGEWLHDWLPPDAHYLGEVLLPGSLYMHHDGNYPVFVKDDEGWPVAEWTTAELYEVDADHPDVVDLLHMECRAGYNAEYWPAYFEVSGKYAGRVVVFTWPHAEHGPAIPNNNWKERANGAT